MEPTSINDRIMLARSSPLPGSITGNRLNFSSILEKEILENRNPTPAFKGESQALPPASEITPSEIAPGKGPLVLVGELTDQTPTVSNLLINNPLFAKECWGIIHSDANQAKPFHRILSGTKIYINPQTKELLWGEMIGANRGPDPAPPAVNMASVRIEPKLNSQAMDGSFSEKLVDAVRPYLGRKYEEIDCYELIVKGLKKMGVKYQGAGGLGHELIKMAVEKNLPINAFLNGEGIIKASGSTVFQKSILKVNDPEKQAKAMIEELTPRLEPGQILSFSTPTKGHTGIISKKDDMWTFINSGDIDNSIGKHHGKKGVGEENLTEEILNWFKMAGSRKQDLKISLGKLSEEKLAAYYAGKKEAATKRV